MATSLLLADDSPTIAKILGMALQSEDYDIRSALTAEEALRELQSSPPNLFLVDLTLPGKSGYEFARLIRADRKLKDTRVLLLASAFDPADENEVKACGADGVITKPFDPGELRRRLRETRDAPRSFSIPEAQGSLSGAPVVAPPSPEELEAEQEPLLAENNELDPASLLVSSEGDANSLLSSAMASESDLTTPPPPSFTLPENSSEFTNATVMLDASLLEAQGNTPSQPIVDLSHSFTTPPMGTDLLDASPLDPPPSPPSSEPLSANAQALAAFFAAEIDANAPPAPPAVSEEDAFDASLSSIEWGEPKADLNEWSSAPPPQASKPSSPSPSPLPEIGEALQAENTPQPARPAPRGEASIRPHSPTFGASSEGGSFLFDTGGSNFRFADDYVKRITKSFTGNLDEMTLGKDSSAPIFHKSSDDRLATQPEASEHAVEATPTESPDPLATKAGYAPTGGGAWSPEEVKRIEQIVRDEVQMVVREIAEKVVWEVVPELAENLIKKELEKVLKEME